MATGAFTERRAVLHDRVGLIPAIDPTAMYPLVESSLSLDEIARHWRRSMKQRPRWEEVLDLLFKAVWGRDLVLRGSSRRERPLEQLLRIASIVRTQPGILFYENEEDLPPEQTELENGSVTVDLRKRIYLPGDRSTWTSAITSAACESLASCALKDYEPDPVGIALRMLEVQREDFAAFCDARGYARPDFWFGPDALKGKLPKGFPGRPSIMREIIGELHRRAAAGVLESKLLDEARTLRTWAEQNIATTSQIPGIPAIQNAIREHYWPLLDKSSSH